MSATADHARRLVEGLRRGEPAAQELLLREYAPRVFELIVRMTGNALDAEELTQDTLLRALRHIDRFDPALSSLQTWLSRIAYRLVLNHLRTPVADVVYMSDDDHLLRIHDEQEMVRAFQQADDAMTDLLQQAVGLLPPSEQTLVTLFYFDDLPLQEIAYIVDAPPGTVATRLHRIRKKLYHLIQKLQQQ